MLPSRLVLSCLLVAGLAAVVRAGDHARLQRLAREFRALEAQGAAIPAPRTQRLGVLERIAALETDEAYRFLVDVSRSVRQSDLTGDVLRLLAGAGPRNPVAAAAFKDRFKPADPHRVLARDFLIEHAVVKRDADWLVDLFGHGSVEDRFLAVRALGRIGSPHTLRCSAVLLRDDSWKPERGSVVVPATLARAVEKMEGEPAARLLLLLRRDARFEESDHAALRDATRLWARSSLRSYVSLAALAAREPEARAEAARFFGEARIEAARAPLLEVAQDAREVDAVRAAAAVALGDLRIARGDLARRLARLLDSDSLVVREAAVRALGRLGVRQAARTLVGLVGTPLEKQARRALSELAGNKPQHDWRAWLESPDCRLPEGS